MDIASDDNRLTGAAYQLALVTPGSLPSRAISRNFTRQRPKRRMYPFGRPLTLHRLWRRLAEELRGSLSSSSHLPSALSFLRISAYCFTRWARLSSRAMSDVLAIWRLILGLI